MDITDRLLIARLENERARLVQELVRLKADESDSDVRREGSPFGKREEEASEALELEKRLVLVKRTNDLLAEIEHALNKAKQGKYGLCDVCGKPIDPARLEALPQASCCLNCKAQQAHMKGRPAAG